MLTDAASTNKSLTTLTFVLIYLHFVIKNIS